MTIAHALDTIYALALLPAEHGRYACLAACASGLYRSDDRGTAWRPLFDALQLDIELPASALALVQEHAAVTIFAAAAGGILRSDDGGHHWQVSMLSTTPVTTAIAASPAFARDGVLFAATLGDGVLRSADRGATWSPWNFGLLDHQALCLAVSPAYASDETVYAGSETGLFRSANGGRSWREVPLPCSTPIISIALPDEQHPGTLVVGTEGAGLWRSTDGGSTWTQATDAPTGATFLSLLCLDVHAEHASVLAVTDGAVFVSSDAGNSWRQADALPTDAEITCAAALPGITLALGQADGNVTFLKLPE